MLLTVYRRRIIGFWRCIAALYASLESCEEDLYNKPPARPYNRAGMGLLDRPFPSSSPKLKAVNSGTFTFLTGASVPAHVGGDSLRAYQGWVSAPGTIVVTKPGCAHADPRRGDGLR